MDSRKENTQKVPSNGQGPLPSILDDLELYSPPTPSFDALEQSNMLTLNSKLGDTMYNDDLDLVTATLAAEATGSKSHVIKEDLRYKIQKKRRVLGKNPLEPEYKQEGPEQLTPADINRRMRRKESNRRAAAKSRTKKRGEQLKKEQEYSRVLQENTLLKEENAKLRQGLPAGITAEQVTQIMEENQRLKETNSQKQNYIDEHFKICPLFVPSNGVPDDYLPHADPFSAESLVRLLESDL